MKSIILMCLWALVLLFLICFIDAKFERVCPERCPADDFKRGHPENIVAENIQKEKDKASTSNSTETKIRIAFVFAGTPRSLILPPLYLSIRENLIASFCPVGYCISDVFIRVSTSDNTHGGLDSVGTLKPGDPKLIPAIEYAISRLNPQQESGIGITTIDWTDIGSEKERNEMLKSNFNNQRHKVFRALDPRRYSMYFNRWSAYQLVKARELALGVQYTWVVHTRLDTVWGEPVRSARDWSQEYVYTPDTWWSDVPDTFALLPRKWSDNFFDIDALVAPTAMCLGGPNFDPLVMQEDSLRSKGLDDSDIKLANEVLCLEVYKNGPKTFQKHPTLGRIPWSDEGYSERILKRKLMVDGISLNYGTLIMHPFSLILTRAPLNPMCNFLHPENHIGWIRTRQSVSIAQYFGCRFMFDELNVLHKADYAGCDADNDFVSHSGSCILDRSVTDWNFLPFRIRYKALRTKLCLQQYLNGSLAFSPCLNYHQHPVTPNINISYSAPQLFLFYPLHKGPQKIRNYGVENTPNYKSSDKVTCLTPSATIDENGYRTLSMRACERKSTAQDFVVSSRNAQISDIITSTKNALSSASLFSIKYVDNIGMEWCMQLTITAKESRGLQPMELILANCTQVQPIQGKRKIGSAILKSEFYLEKTYSEGPTLSPLFGMGKHNIKDISRDSEDSNIYREKSKDVEDVDVSSTSRNNYPAFPSIYDRTGLIDQLKTDDAPEGEGSSRRKKRKGIGKMGKTKIKGKAKVKGKAKATDSTSKSALLPQKRQGRMNEKIKWAVG